MLSSTIENYLKELFLLNPKGEKQIATGELARSLGVTPGSATSMIKTLAQDNLVEHRPHYGVKLTEMGRDIAIHVVRRHRIVELFLVKILGMDWSKVHEEAEKLEHVVSDEVIKKMDELLGHPTHDPHGDPIPTSEGELPERSLQLLSFCKEGECASVARLGNQDTDFLQFAENNGLLLGKTIEITKRSDIADSITIKSQGKEIVLGMAAASKIEVEDA